MNLQNCFRGKKYDLFLAWFLIGFIFSFSMCLIYLSGSKSITNLYDVGKVYEIRDSLYKTAEIQEKGHQESSGKVVLDQGYFRYETVIKGDKKPYKYFCIQLKNLNTDTMEWIIDFRKKRNGEVIQCNEIHCSMNDGMNLIEIPKKSFNTIAIGINGEKGSSFTVEKMELRETKPVYNANKALKVILVTYLVYTIVSGMLILCWRKFGIALNLYSWIEVLQEIYIIIAKQLQKIMMYFSLTSKYKNLLVTFFFVILFLYSTRVEIVQNYYIRFKYHIVVYSVLLLLISLLFVESKLEKKKWNNSLVWCWLILWLMTCCSDFLIPKNFRFVGYIMIFIVGFFAFVWNNMERPDNMIRNFTNSVHIFLGIISVFCIICRPELESSTGIRYSGISKNPGVFALYLATIFAIILGEIDNSIKKRDQIKKILFFIFEGCVTLTFCWKSQSLCPLLCIVGISSVWFIRMICHSRTQNCRKLIITVIISFIILMIPTYLLIDFGVKNVPQFLGTSVTYEGEKPVAKQQYGMVVYAGDLKEKLEESRLGQKVNSLSLSTILSGRNYYYRGYLREMNLFGHKENATMWGVKRKPHNAILGIAHRYGIFASVPYILMLVMVIIRTFHYSRKDVPYAAVPFYVCLSSIVMSMADNVEQPFMWLPWIGLYLMMGIVFDDDIFQKKGNQYEC